MSPEGFRQALRTFTTRPRFHSFRIEFVTGEEIHVRYPEAVYIREDVVVHVAPNRHRRFFDSHSVCQLQDEERPVDIIQ
jgi:hypothetical protein